MSLSMLDSTKRQLEEYKKKLSEWMELTINHKDNKSIVEMTHRQRRKLEHKIRETENSVRQQVKGLRYTQNGWEE